MRIMEPATTVLGGIVVVGISAAVGKYLGGNGKVTEEHCEEKRTSCQNLLVTKIDNLTGKVESLTKIVNAKFLGL